MSPESSFVNSHMRESSPVPFLLVTPMATKVFSMKEDQNMSFVISTEMSTLNCHFFGTFCCFFVNKVNYIVIQTMKKQPICLGNDGTCIMKTQDSISYEFFY